MDRDTLEVIKLLLKAGKNRRGRGRYRGRPGGRLTRTRMVPEPHPQPPAYGHYAPSPYAYYAPPPYYPQYLYAPPQPVWGPQHPPQLVNPTTSAAPPQAEDGSAAPVENPPATDPSVTEKTNSI